MQFIEACADGKIAGFDEKGRHLLGQMRTTLGSLHARQVISTGANVQSFVNAWSQVANHQMDDPIYAGLGKGWNELDRTGRLQEFKDFLRPILIDRFIDTEETIQSLKYDFENYDESTPMAMSEVVEALIEDHMSNELEALGDDTQFWVETMAKFMVREKQNGTDSSTA